MSEVEPAGRKATDSTRADHRVADPPHAPDSPLLSRGAGANPHRLAGLFLKERLTFSEGIGLRFWRDVFYFWDGSAYRQVPTGEIRPSFRSRWPASSTGCTTTSWPGGPANGTRLPRLHGPGDSLDRSR